MAAPLRCPHCGAEFDFEAWSKTASCPSCGERVRFEAAAAAGAGPAATTPPGASLAPGTPPGVGPARAVPAGPPVAITERSFLGKPLRWTAAWTAVVLIWVAAAAGLAAVRVDIGHLTQLTPRERTAIDEVRSAKLEGDVTYGQALAGVLTRYGALLGVQPGWYVQDRAWEQRLYVTWELGSDIRMGWMVTYDGRVTPTAETALFLKENLRAGTPTPLPTALPTQLPGL